MREQYDYYTVTLTARGPIFIGDGNQLSKKEYIYDKARRKVIIPKFDKMYQEIQRRGYEQKFQDYMLQNGKVTLEDWLNKNRFSDEDYLKWKKYELDCGDAIIDRGKPLELRTFMKDAYGKPYIPGSSLKGMLRTLLLAYDISSDSYKYDRMQCEIFSNSQKPDNRKYYLSKEIKKVEVERFNLLEKEKKQKDKMTNDIMSCMVVSDSAPLDVTDLVLCQKLDVHTDGSQRKLNLLRECLKPETKIQFELKIAKDTQITKQLLIDAIESFGDTYYNAYLKKYDGVDRPKSNTVWIGGGTGFVTKTIIYSMFQGTKGVRVTNNILEVTLGKKFKEHKHDSNLKKGLAPHIIKMTKYKGKLYQMGEAELGIDKLV